VSVPAKKSRKPGYVIYGGQGSGNFGHAGRPTQANLTQSDTSTLLLVPSINIYAKLARVDPTRTLVLRNNFVAQMTARFRKLKAIIQKAVVDDDCFGIAKPESQGRRIVVQADLTTRGGRSFDFPTSQEKSAAFLEWLRTQEQAGILETVRIPQVGTGIESAWTDVFIKDSYQRGVQRARDELLRGGYAVPSMEVTGGISASMMQPMHINRLGVAFSRTFDGLKGITSAMDTQISHVLTKGLADGDGQATIAKKLLATIDGNNAGTLGITDSLGRFIPAERRAAMLARTEVIRAHAQGTLQEFKNWGVAGVDVLAEWVTAGFNVCPECQELAEKGPYKIEEAWDMLPAHPHCFISPMIPIYTSTGWRPIGTVQVGDMVLTHKGRFKRVYGLPRTLKQTPEVVHFSLRGFDNDGVTMTTNHPVLVSNKLLPPHWKEAGKCTLEDRIVLFASRCKRCDKKIPWFRTYCSGSCCSSDNAERQWADPAHRENVSKKNREANLRQYASGERDRFATKKANEKIRKMIKDGTWGTWMCDDFFKKVFQVTNTPEQIAVNSERMKKKNPMHDPAIVAKATASLIKTLELHPEKRLNARMAKHRKSNKMTGIEQLMAQLLDRLGIEYIFQYPILRYDVDFAIPTLKIAIECDGEYWHQDKQKDLIRQKRIEAEGWFVLRYTETKINQCFDEIEDEVVRVLANHNGDYEFVGHPIKKIERRTVTKPLTLYNLAVEEDESYIARGLVVHNCRCAWLAKPIDGKEKTPVEVAPEDIVSIISPEDSVFDSIANNYLESPSSIQGRDRTLEGLAETQGFTQLPKVVSGQEFEDIVQQQGMKELFRGVQNSNIANMFATGDYYGATGAFGSGTYAAMEQDLAKLYMAGDNAVLMRMGLPADVKIGKYADVLASMKQDTTFEKAGSKVFMQGFKENSEFLVEKGKVIESVTKDVGRWAVVNGYDAIQAPDQMIILNRSKVLVSNDLLSREGKVIRLLPETPAAGVVKWKPVMSKAEAEKFIEGSKYTEDVYHVTYEQNAKAIMNEGFDLEKKGFGRVFGEGVYAGMDLETKSIYRIMAGGLKTESLTLKVKVDNPLFLSGSKMYGIDKTNIYEDIVNKKHQFMKEINKNDIKLSNQADIKFPGNPSGKRQWLNENGFVGYSELDSKAFTMAVKDFGYDSIIIEEKGGPTKILGGNQIITFDPKKVVVIK